MRLLFLKLLFLMVLYVGLGCGKNLPTVNTNTFDTSKSTIVLPCGCDSPVIQKYSNEIGNLACMINYNNGQRQYLINIPAGPNVTRTVYICDTTFPGVASIINNQVNKIFPVIFSGELKNRCVVEYTIWEKLYNISLTDLKIK